jgi:Domain of unknown function (DUF4190)
VSDSIGQIHPFHRTGSPPLVPDRLARRRNGLGTGALALGICGITSFPLYGGIALGVPGLILGVMGIRYINHGNASNKKVAIAGVVLSFLGLVLSICFFAIGMFLLVEQEKKCFDTVRYPTESERQVCLDEVWG